MSDKKYNLANLTPEQDWQILCNSQEEMDVLIKLTNHNSGFAYDEYCEWDRLQPLYRVYRNDVNAICAMSYYLGNENVLTVPYTQFITDNTN